MGEAETVYVFFLHVAPEPLGACDALRGLLDNAIHGDAAQFDHCLRQETYHLRLVMSVERFLKQPNKFHYKSAFQTEEERTFTNDMLTFLLNLEQRNKHAHGEGCSQYIARLRALSEAWNSGFFHTACVVVRRHSSCAHLCLIYSLQEPWASGNPKRPKSNDKKV